MGGLITRWALKEMENAGENHQTNLFISYDSPHQGANSPLAYQYLARHVRNQYIKTGVTALAVETVQLFRGGASPFLSLSIANTSASRQMLINYVNDFGTIDNSFHDQWQTELKNMGYPQGDVGSPLRNVAVSNASECATSQLITPNGSLLSYVGKGNTTFLGDLAGMYLLPFAGALLNRPALFLGKLSGRNDFNIDMQLNANGNLGGNRVYYNKVSFTKRFLWLIPITVNLTNKSNYAPSTLPYESYPGGFNSAPLDFSSSSTPDNWLSYFIKYDIVASNQPNYNFVPATSALDIGGGNVTLTAADYTTKYIVASPPTGTKSSPFANFITAFNNGSSANESHLTITTRNGDWVAAELNRASLGVGNLPVAIDCTYMCDGLVIEGPAQFCPTETYTISNLPAGTTITWSATGGITVPANSIGSSVVATAVLGGGELTATVSSICGITSVVKSINYNNSSVSPVTPGILGPYISWNITDPNYISIRALCNFTSMQFIFPNAVNVTATHIPNQSPYVAPPTVLSGNIVNFNYDGAGTLYVKYDLPCGTVNQRIYVTTWGCGNNPWQNFSYYPNPANMQLTVSYAPPSTLKTVDGFEPMPVRETKQFAIELYNDKAKRLKKVANGANEKDIVISTQDLPNGTYFLHIIDGKEVIKKQIVVQH